jgi:hypothetical protein
MKARVLALLSLCWVAALPAGAAESAAWAGYLDYAYVYSSAEPDALRQRLAQYGKEAGIKLEDYAKVSLSGSAIKAAPDPDVVVRRAAIAHLLLYLATGTDAQLDRSVDMIDDLSGRLERNENRYWYHYILAHRALENGQRFDFVGELLDLWLHVIVPLETPYDTLQTLSLSDSPNSGFVAALPYLYENLARLILIRSQQMGVHDGLDPLAAIVRMLADGRVGAHPDVIPPALSARDYVRRIVTRLDGTESDAGSLSFTLALFEASKYHDIARGLLAERGFDPETLKALRVATGAYDAAVGQAVTLQGKAAVYTRVLRQLGEVYAAKQRLGVDPEIDSSFSIEGAIEVFGELQSHEKQWKDEGYRSREAYLAAMHGLWEEIQETSLNAADYYLTRAIEKPHMAADHAHNAARIYARFLTFFQKFATLEGRETVPDSAFFAAYEAARGYGDSLQAYAGQNLSRAELEQSTHRYVAALRLFPFDRALWPSLKLALERVGRENEYLALARPIAESVTTSRAVDGWIQGKEPGADRIAVIRRALSDSQVLVYLGFAEENTVQDLESSLAELRTKHGEAERELAALSKKRDALGRTAAAPAAPDPNVDEAAGDAARSVDALEVEELDTQISQARSNLVRVEKQIAARTTALPLFKATLGTESLAGELRARRDHPMHKLLRRMFYEGRA